MENTWVPQKVKRRIKITLLPTNSTLRYILQRMENRNSNKYLYASVPRGTLHKSQKAETTQTSISGSMSKENVPHTHNGTLFTHRCYNMAEPQNHYVKWKNADTEGVCMITFIRNTQRLLSEGKFRETESWLMTARDWGRRKKLGATAY